MEMEEQMAAQAGGARDSGEDIPLPFLLLLL